MDLTIKDRLLLWNQFSILELLKPEDAAHYGKLKTILQNGYRLHYDDLCGHLDKNEFSEEAALEVIAILSMFEAIQDSVEKIGAVEGVEDRMVQFAGFDGTNECEQLGYLYFLVDQQERFRHVVKKRDYNSHAPLLGKYREMLSRYKKLGNPKLLIGEEIKILTSVFQVEKA